MGRNGIDILFLFPPSIKSIFTYNLGIGYLSAYVNEKGFSSSIFLSEETDLQKCIKGILSYRPKIAAFSVLNHNYVNCLLIARRLKQVDPSVMIVFGGPAPTVHHRTILLNNKYVDVCVRGEGEEILLMLLEHLKINHFRKDRAGLDSIEGISYIQKGEVLVNEPADILFRNRKFKNYIDHYPSPYLSGIIPASQAHKVGIITARGCNQNCVYCNCALLSHNHVFVHSVDRVLEELQFIGSQSPGRHVSIFDDAFTIFPGRTRKICQGIIERKIDLRLSCITRCDKITRELLDLMKDAGFTSISFSLESSVPRILRVLGKVHPPEDIPSGSLDKEAAFIDNLGLMTAHAKKIGMNPVRLSIMVGSPSETPDEARQTIDYLKKLEYHSYTHNLFSLFEGTPVFPAHKKYGYRLKRFSKNQLLYHTCHPYNVFDIPHAQNSALLQEARHNDLDNLNVLGLATKRTHVRPWFDNVIVHSDFLGEPLIEWLKNNLVFNGKIIQIYSDLESYKQHLSRNYASLFDQCAPSTQLIAYYLSKQSCTEDAELIPGRGGPCKGNPVKIMGIHRGLNFFQSRKDPDFPVICRELDPDDSRELTGLLRQFRKVGSLVEHLASSGPYPVFSTLCKWLSKGANCNLFETAIIDDGGNIRICPDGAPVGVVPMHISEIMCNLQAIKTDHLKERGCRKCTRAAECAMCCFPGPLPVDEYCRFKREENCLEEARTLKSYWFFKDLLNVVFAEEHVSEKKQNSSYNVFHR